MPVVLAGVLYPASTLLSEPIQTVDCHGTLLKREPAVIPLFFRWSGDSLLRFNTGGFSILCSCLFPEKYACIFAPLPACVRRAGRHYRPFWELAPFISRVSRWYMPKNNCFWVWIAKVGLSLDLSKTRCKFQAGITDVILWRIDWFCPPAAAVIEEALNSYKKIIWYFSRCDNKNHSIW